MCWITLLRRDRRNHIQRGGVSREHLMWRWKVVFGIDDVHGKYTFGTSGCTYDLASGCLPAQTKRVVNLSIEEEEV